MVRGDVHTFRPPPTRGHEQRGRRYAVIVQASEMLPRSVVIVAPTSQSAPPRSYRPEVVVKGRKTKVLVEQLGAVDATRLGNRIGRLEADELWAVDDALRAVLGLR